MPRTRIFLLLILINICLYAAAQTVCDSVLTIKGDTREIGAYAYADRTDIRKVVWESPVSLQSIGEYAFLGCVNLKEIDLPGTLAEIGEGAFRECASLREVILPEGVVKLPRYVFSWCKSLQKAVLPSRLADIGSGCFAYCESLPEISFSSSIEHIGANAFSFCSSLGAVTMPASITELESYAFSECINLKEAALPANNHLLGELIFSGCQNLETISCGSPVPAKFDCNSTLFEENEAFMYERCQLLVPENALHQYKEAPGWRLFKKINALSD